METKKFDNGKVNKGKIYIVNAFSLNMLNNLMKDAVVPLNITVSNAKLDDLIYCTQLNRHYDVINAIGHADLANIFKEQTNSWNIDLPDAERTTVNVNSIDYIFVVQYIGPRLPEGTTKLPEGAKLKYFFISF